MIDYTKYRMNQLNSACAEFIRQESAGSLLLMLATIIAMVLANSPMAETYEHALHLFVDLPLLPDMSLLHWVNDGLMAIFFLVVGMEIKSQAGMLEEIGEVVVREALHAAAGCSF